MKIDLDETFPHLNKAPIHEAALNVRTEQTWAWKKDDLLAAIKQRLQDYPEVKAIQHLRQSLTLTSDSTTVSIPDTQFTGVRMASADKVHVAQFRREGFNFSRLRPYQDFSRLREEAERLWAIYRELMQPAVVRGLGLRFINQIGLPSSDFERWLRNSPRPPSGLQDAPYIGFTHQDAFTVPETPYAVKLVCMIQPKSNALLVDIDVTTIEPFRTTMDEVFFKSEEMRWLKNKVFFSVISDWGIQELQ